MFMFQRIIILLIFLCISLSLCSPSKAYFENPVISNFTYHDASLIQGEDGFFYSFVSSVVPRESAMAYYTVSIFKSGNLINWCFDKYAFEDKYIEKRLVNGYDKKHVFWGKYPYHLGGKTTHYAIWAPDIFKFRNKYYLFVSFHLSVSDTKIAVFESDSINKDFKFLQILVSSNKEDGDYYVDTEELIDPFPITVGRETYLMYGSFRRDSGGKWLPKRLKMGVYISQLKMKNGKFTLGKRIFVTDYYEGCMVIPHGGKFWLLGTNGSLLNSTYKIDYAVTDRITGPYLNRIGKAISDTINFNPGTPILKTTANQRFNGFGCPSNPIIDKNGQYWLMMHGHAKEFSPIQMEKAEQERYTFLIPLYWDKDGSPYFDMDEIQNNRIAYPVL